MQGPCHLQQSWLESDSVSVVMACLSRCVNIFAPGACSFLDPGCRYGAAALARRSAAAAVEERQRLTTLEQSSCEIARCGEVCWEVKSGSMREAAWPMDGSMFGVAALIVLTVLLVSFLLLSELKEDGAGEGQGQGFLGGGNSDGVHSPRGVMERCMQRVELVRCAEVDCGF